MRPDSRGPAVFGSIVFVPAMPRAKATTTNASQPNVAVFQWSALHRPIRAATFLGVLPDISLLLSVGKLMAMTLGGRRRGDIGGGSESSSDLTPISSSYLGRSKARSASGGGARSPHLLSSRRAGTRAGLAATGSRAA